MCNFIKTFSRFLCSKEDVIKYRKEIIDYNRGTLHGVSIIGTVLCCILMILSLPFIGILELFVPYTLLTVAFFMIAVATKTILKAYPSMAALLFYMVIVSVLFVAAYMGSVMGPDSNATTFVLFLLILSLFFIDCPWRIIIVNGVMVLIFCYMDIQYKSSRELLSLDIANALVVWFVNALFTVFSFRRNIERFRTERESKKQASDRDFLINSLPVGVAVYEVKGTAIEATYTNDQFYRLFEDDREGRIQRSDGDFRNNIHPNDRVKVLRAVKNVIDGENYRSEICRLVKGDETYLWVRISAAVAKREDDDLLVYCTYESVEEEIKSKQATQAKTEFLSRMSHDIRTPMNAIIGLTNLAKEEKNIDIIYEYLGHIDITCDFLLGLINDILDLNKIESGQFVLNPEPYLLSEFHTEVNTIIRPLMKKKNINFVYRVDCGLSNIIVDKLRFNQIFFNLLSNASKFTPDGGTVEFLTEPIPETKNHISGKEKLHGVRFIVKDNGIGMSEEYQKKMFVPFVQEENQINEQMPGTGLGLPIVKSLAESMGATIQVKSKLGKGTEYILDFYVETAEQLPTEKNITKKTESLENMEILLVEDNDMNILVAQRLLESRGCHVTVAKNGQEAVDKFEASKEHFYHAILMDVRMPVMDGIEATKRIRSLNREDSSKVGIIAMTAEAFTEEKKNTIEAGMNEHLSKPIVPQTLFKALSQYGPPI